MIPILVLKTENKVIYNKSNLNCKTFFEEFILNEMKECHILFLFKDGEIVGCRRAQGRGVKIHEPFCFRHPRGGWFN